MAAAPDVFSVEPDEVIGVVGEMAEVLSSLHELATDLARRIEALHLGWDGAAAQAHRVAFADWEQGFDAMRRALAGMEEVAEVAHRNYTAAADSNLAMWRRVR